MTETDLMNNIMIALCQRKCKTFRRNTGLFYAKHGNKYTPVKIGDNGQSDLSGHRPDGRAFYLEVKTPKEYAALMSRIERKKTTKHDDEQNNFIRAMRESGAIAGLCDSVESAIALVFGEDNNG